MGENDSVRKDTTPWEEEQEILKKKLYLKDTELWQKALIELDNCAERSKPVTHQYLQILDKFDISRETIDTAIELCPLLKPMEIAEKPEQSNESAVNLFKTPSYSLLSFIGGLDISYRKDDNNACVALVVISFPELKLVYESCFMVEVTKPYVPGFLAFREVEFFMKAVNELKAKSSEFFPQVILVDGNGILHPKMFGLASHLGVLLDIPCIGVAKSLHFVDGLQRDVSYRQKVESLNKAGDYFYLLGTTGNILGAALKTCKAAKNPVFVSQGHRCSLESAIAVVKLCSIYRVPEPTRLADIQSRKFLQQEIHTSSSCKPNTTR